MSRPEDVSEPEPRAAPMSGPGTVAATVSVPERAIAGGVAAGSRTARAARDPETAPQVRITVDGRPIDARPGVSLAASLLTVGKWDFRTSETGQRRGPLCAMGTCFECRVTVGGERHVRACLVPVREGMVVRTDD